MEYIFATLFYIFLFLVVFGLPLEHLINLLKNQEKIVTIYESPPEYRKLAAIQVVNMVFLLVVFISFWWMLKDAGSGSFNVIMLLPFLLIYIAINVVTEKGIRKLPRIKKDNWR